MTLDQELTLGAISTTLEENMKMNIDTVVPTEIANENRSHIFLDLSKNRPIMHVNMPTLQAKQLVVQYP